MTDSSTYSIPHKWLRPVSLMFDSIIYFLLTVVFKVFFNIANASILNNEIVNQFYSRLQLLIGIFITFKISFSIIEGIVNPDQVSDSKKGPGNVVIRIFLSLIMLTLITPLSGIPDDAANANSYNKALKEQGILFGTLQSAQERILNQNIIGKLILGIDNNNSDETDNVVLMQADRMVATIVRGFISVNMSNDHWVCKGNLEEDNSYKMYKEGNYSSILSAADHPCDSNYTGSGDRKYKLSYIWGFSWIIGIAFIFVVAGFCVDIAVRLIKLSVLRIIAPIPIISYIDPKSDKDGAFGAWTKMLTKTYLDLFVRLIIIYFIMFIASNMIDMVDDNLVFKNGGMGSFLNSISIIVIWFGLFVFAKQAPKFFMDMLGIKGDSKGFFSGIGAIAGVGSFTGGLVGGMIGTGVRYGRQSYRESMENNPNPSAKQKIGNAFKAFGAGLVGAGTGGVVAANASAHAKDHKFSAGMNAAKQRALVREKGFTLRSRTKQSLGDLLGANAKDDRRIAINDDFIDAFKFVDDQLDNDVAQINYTNVNTNGTNAIGGSLSNTSIKKQIKVLEAMRASGQYDANQITSQEDLITAMKKQRYTTRSADRNDAIFADVERMKAAADKNSYNVNVNDYDSVKGVRYEADRNTHRIKTSQRYVAAQKFKEINKR